MEFRDSLSRLKNKFKHGLIGTKLKSSETGTDAGGGNVDPTGSRPASEAHLVAGGSHNQEGKGPDADGGQALSMIRPPQLEEPGSVSAHVSVSGQGRGADVDGGEPEQTHSHLHSVSVEIAEGSGPAEDGGAVERTHPSPSIMPVLRDGKPDGA